MIDVIFDRVGLHGSTHPGTPPPPDPLTVHQDDPGALDEAIHAYVGPYMLSRRYTVLLDRRSGRGCIAIGHVAAGSFTVRQRRPARQGVPA